MKKILIIGIKGMAGHILYKYFSENEKFDVYGIARNIESSINLFNLDVSDTTELKTIIENNTFDFIINAIGILNKDAEDNPAKAIWFNSYFPHFLEEITRDTTTKVIHISTDCVFSGKDNGGYTEESFKNGIGFYAQSKALGEIVNNKDLTIRTSIIGPELNRNGIGLFHWFMTQSGVINGYKNAIWSGVTTLELAKAIEFMFDQPIVGLVHLTNGHPINKFDLLNLFEEIWNKGIEIVAVNGKSVDKSLSKSSKILYQVPSYKNMLEEQFIWMQKNHNLYTY